MHDANMKNEITVFIDRVDQSWWILKGTLLVFNMERAAYQPQSA